MKCLFKKDRWSYIPYTRSAYAHPSLGYTFDYEKRTRKLISDIDGDQIKFEKTEG
jgi:hypothetical protein